MASNNTSNYHDNEAQTGGSQVFGNSVGQGAFLQTLQILLPPNPSPAQSARAGTSANSLGLPVPQNSRSQSDSNISRSSTLGDNRSLNQRERYETELAKLRGLYLNELLGLRALFAEEADTSSVTSAENTLYLSEQRPAAPKQHVPERQEPHVSSKTSDDQAFGILKTLLDQARNNSLESEKRVQQSQSEIEELKKTLVLQTANGASLTEQLDSEKHKVAMLELQLSQAYKEIERGRIEKDKISSQLRSKLEILEKQHNDLQRDYQKSKEEISNRENFISQKAPIEGVVPIQEAEAKARLTEIWGKSMSIWARKNCIIEWPSDFDFENLSIKVDGVFNFKPGLKAFVRYFKISPEELMLAYWNRQLALHTADMFLSLQVWLTFIFSDSRPELFSELDLVLDQFYSSVNQENAPLLYQWMSQISQALCRVPNAELRNLTQLTLNRYISKSFKDFGFPLFRNKEMAAAEFLDITCNAANLIINFWAQGSFIRCNLKLAGRPYRPESMALDHSIHQKDINKEPPITGNIILLLNPGIGGRTLVRKPGQRDMLSKTQSWLQPTVVVGNPDLQPWNRR